MKLYCFAMKPANFWLIGLLTVLCSTASGARPEEELTSSPYTAISRRNVFDLKPFVPVDSKPSPPAEPPANIVLIGAKDWRGEKTAIISVQQLPKPGQPLSTKTYYIKEGETQGPISVVRIANVKTGEMEIVNNGVTTNIDFKSHGGKLPPSALAGGIPQVPGLPGLPGAAAIPVPGVAGAIQRPATVVSGGGRVMVPAPAAVESTAVTTPRPMRISPGAPQYNLGGVPLNPAPQATTQPEQPVLSREVQAIMIEMERVRTQPLVDKGIMPPLPPTEIMPTPQEHKQ